LEKFLNGLLVAACHYGCSKQEACQWWCNVVFF
jgi:hypothetical protein